MDTQSLFLETVNLTRQMGSVTNRLDLVHTWDAGRRKNIWRGRGPSPPTPPFLKNTAGSWQLDRRSVRHGRDVWRTAPRAVEPRFLGARGTLSGSFSGCHPIVIDWRISGTLSKTRV